MKDSSNEDKGAYKLVQPGDLVYNKMRAWQGAIGLSSHRGIVSPAYIVQRPRTRTNARFFHYLLRTPAFAKEAERWSYGITSDQWSLRPQHFKMIWFPVPPIDEQDAIVRFLDDSDRRIRRAIRAKQKLIALLNEQKQVVIHRAVTRGLDPNVRLKPSGLDWLGDVPGHWEYARLKFMAAIQTGITLGQDYGRQELIERPYLRVANVQSGRLDLSKVTTVWIPRAQADATTLRMGDVLMTEGGDIDKLGRGCLWRDEVAECVHQNHVFAVRPRKESLLSDYLLALLASRCGRMYFEITAKKTTNLASTNSTTLGNFAFFIPRVDEQAHILESIARTTSDIVRAQDRAEREIVLLREYGARLVADVVTGKLDVREVAARLPDDPEPLDEAGVEEPEEDPELEAVEA